MYKNKAKYVFKVADKYFLYLKRLYEHSCQFVANHLEGHAPISTEER